jgi:hypothetical protein
VHGGQDLAIIENIAIHFLGFGINQSLKVVSLVENQSLPKQLWIFHQRIKQTSF